MEVAACTHYFFHTPSNAYNNLSVLQLNCTTYTSYSHQEQESGALLLSSSTYSILLQMLDGSPSDPYYIAALLTQLPWHALLNNLDIYFIVALVLGEKLLNQSYNSRK